MSPFDTTVKKARTSPARAKLAEAVELLRNTGGINWNGHVRAFLASLDADTEEET